MSSVGTANSDAFAPHSTLCLTVPEAASGAFMTPRTRAFSADSIRGQYLRLLLVAASFALIASVVAAPVLYP
jgi:hypothetical protein